MLSGSDKAATRFSMLTLRASASGSFGLNWTNSVPASMSAVWPGPA